MISQETERQLMKLTKAIESYGRTVRFKGITNGIWKLSSYDDESCDDMDIGVIDGHVLCHVWKGPYPILEDWELSKKTYTCPIVEDRELREKTYTYMILSWSEKMKRGNNSGNKSSITFIC